MKKRSEEIRLQIGRLLCEQQMYQGAGNDDQHEIIQNKIDVLRSQIITVEIDERNMNTVNDD